MIRQEYLMARGAEDESAYIRDVCAKCIEMIKAGGTSNGLR